MQNTDILTEELMGDDLARVNAYAEEVLNAFDALFKDAEDRFKDSALLLKRFTKAVDAARSNGWSEFHAVEETHNELCIVDSLLSSTEPAFASLEYEPVLAGCSKSIDFRASSDEVTVYIDVKTIAPRPTDRWDQFVAFEQQRRFPERMVFILEREWLGGELWHNMFASRARMLEHTLALEKKISDANLAATGTFFVLALCGHEFHWRQRKLEDFVSFYRTGFHRPDDPFSTAEAKTIEEKELHLSGQISQFACMFRPQFGIYPNRLNWHVEAPRYV
jgi:hypothetical protein